MFALHSVDAIAAMRRQFVRRRSRHPRVLIDPMVSRGCRDDLPAVLGLGCATGDVPLHIMSRQTQLVDGFHDFDEPFLRYKSLDFSASSIYPETPVPPPAR